jgi:hypothetical protein
VYRSNIHPLRQRQLPLNGPASLIALLVASIVAGQCGFPDRRTYPLVAVVIVIVMVVVYGYGHVKVGVDLSR